MLAKVATFLFDSGKEIFDSILNDWGLIGYGIIFMFIMPRVVNIMKRFFK